MIEEYVRPDILEIEPYEPPNLEEIAALAGLKVQDLIRLNANENPFGPSPRVIEALGDISSFARYPDERPLCAAVARYAGVAKEQVILGNGSNELIDQVIRMLLEPGQGLLVCPPTFGMYRFFACLGRHPVWAIPRDAKFRLDLEAIEALCGRRSEDRPRVLFLPSPGNPDGQAIPLQTVERLLRLSWVVVIDEAYIEFVGLSALPLLSEHDNLILLRSFSKWAGLAGLRLGYALLSPRLAGSMKRLCIPYSVNAAAIAAALATLDDLQAVQANVARVVAGRQWLQAALAEIPWLEPLPSQANFILCRVRERSGSELARALASRGILVRDFSSQRLKDYIRISVGRPEQNHALLRVLQEVPAIDPPPNAPSTNLAVARTRRIHAHSSCCTEDQGNQRSGDPEPGRRGPLSGRFGPGFPRPHAGPAGHPQPV